ncbi:hypothetical protein VEA_001365 [Vibrio antiquarius]|uniref:Uncharacterized protein n=1 Tax=Vibrio antiquarius (strain Ex25) TaxID=150340 RepID=A0ACA6QUU0_VIBAE|nr:hypothetical protein VEA_001365 [Vibrio antiquarius]
MFFFQHFFKTIHLTLYFADTGTELLLISGCMGHDLSSLSY